MSSGTSATALPPIHSYSPPPNLPAGVAVGGPSSPPPGLSSSSQSRSPPTLVPASAAGATPRNTKARACTNCKTKKIACRPGSVPGVCVKCHRDNKRCIVEEPTPRPVRGKGTSKARVAEMEKKLDGLVALLTGAQSVSSNPNSSGAAMSDQEQAAIGLATLAPSLSRQYGQNDTSSGSGENRPHDLACNSHGVPDFNVGACLSALKSKEAEREDRRRQEQKQREEEEQRQQIPKTTDCAGFNFIMSQPAAPQSPLWDPIGRNLVTEAEAEQFLATFVEMSVHFPFYVLPAGATVASLRRDKPMLLLAILTAASQSNKRVQIALGWDFRKAYSERLLIHGEKSLELVQAGMIYMSWFHCHFSPKTQIFLQMVYLLISLITELGYDRKPDRDRPGAGPMTMGGSGDPVPSSTSPRGGRQDDGSASSPRVLENEPPVSLDKVEEREFRTREIRRTLLGCWWLTSMISIDFRKRIPLHFSSYMRQCQQTFMDNPEFESDKYMVLLLRLHKLQEDICETFRYHEPEVAGKQDLVRIQMSLKAFHSVLKDLEREIEYLDPRYPAHDSIYPLIFSVGMYLYEIGLHMSPPPPSTTSYAPTASLEYTSERINILGECLSYTRRFLDCVTTRPPVTFRLMCSPSWMRISYGLIVLSKLALGGTEPVDLCNIKEKTVIQYSNRHYTTLNPHPSVLAEQEREKERQRITGRHRSASPERPGIAYIPSPSNVDGWDTSVVRAAVKLEVYLERLVNLCKLLHIPPPPVKEEDRERYKANNVDENPPPDLYDFGMWMFATMKEWYLAMVKREEDIEAAARDAVGSGGGSMEGVSTANNTGSGTGADSSATPGGSTISGGMSSSRTRSTSASIVTPGGGGNGMFKDWATPTDNFQRLKRKYEVASDGNWSNAAGVASGGGSGNGNGNQGLGAEYGNPGNNSMVLNGTAEDAQMQMQMQMQMPQTIGFEFMDTLGDDFWGAMWSSWPLFYPTGA
ncbi:Transcription factor himD [Drechslerella dactyloides]|uniref:Transcription factor himD n=1 Tax=Drechslerella dactyloides TaxID=74499 RepID=A0AAD6NLK2_DREDA|nr:Transcription factor himD [Drechslerella dactyloides]